MQETLAALEGWAAAEWLRASRWGYATVNALHILGIALLVGAIAPLNLRLLGFWRSIQAAALARVLVPVAASGLVLAAAAGLLLFSVRAREYADVEFFQIKLLLVVLGVASALWAHWRHGALLNRAPAARLKAHAVLSICCWTGALVCGRFIAFAAG